MALDVSAWHSLELEEAIAEGNRNEVWRGSMGGAVVSVRQSRRDESSLNWELDLIDHLDRLGFRVPTVIDSTHGQRHDRGVVVQRWLDGRPPESAQDWLLVADELQRIHRSTTGYPQRPGCSAVAQLTRSSSSVDARMSALPDDVATEVLAVFADVGEMPLAVVHGDPMAANVRIDDDGIVGLLDFDESRLDVGWHDLSNLGIQVLDDAEHERAVRLSNAWEAANGWVVEPAYARRRFEALSKSLR